MKYSFFSFFTKLTLAASAAVSLAGCDDPELPEAKPDTTASTLTGRYSLVNVSPGSGDAQLRSIDNVPVTTPQPVVPYLGTGAYTPVTSGQRLLLFSTTNNLNSSLIPARNAFNSNASYTVFLTDAATRASSATDQGGARSVVLTDNLAAPSANRARIRFVNLSPSYSAGADSLGLYTITSPSTTGATAPNRYLFAPIGRSYRSTTFTVPAVAATATTPGRASRSLNFANFTDVPAGTYTFQVRRSATAASNASQVIIQATPLTFASGKIYTIYSRGTNASMSATPLGISVVQHN
ncbi:DUF4397 domain-containing protein [Hymenobacter tibetensis]|uniref:DUF4397 domain-containing protein n=1 Tax=Hymenobacter tibetensis TaxID=497967 RepID=A0ABY4D060_9BACT|nr:DUF4397 domain-containing protein [Hymenobacter tibetensis]UOG75920.1 DUF4397 domain-containing protein [Hymenobacter tibetensis]